MIFYQNRTRKRAKPRGNKEILIDINHKCIEFKSHSPIKRIKLKKVFSNSVNLY